MSKTVVFKFGGTSLADASGFQQAKSIIASSPDRVIAVVSAVAGVTDSLIATCKSAQSSSSYYLQLLEQIKSKHLKIASDLGISLDAETNFENMTSVLKTINLTKLLSTDIEAFIIGHGELLSMKILSAFMEDTSSPLDARDFLTIASSEDNTLEILWEESAARLATIEDPDRNMIMTGFVCRTADGRMATLRRNGSDYSASIVAKLVKAKNLTIWKEVDGILSADPRMVRNARPVPELSYDEAAELAYFGAKVLHPLTMIPAIEYNIPIYVKNSYQPHLPGTIISSKKSSEPGLAGVTYVQNLCVINVGGCGMIGLPSMAEKVFAAVKLVATSVFLISQASSGHSICFVVLEMEAEAIVAKIRDGLYREIIERKLALIEIIGEVAIVACVGDKLRHWIGFAAKFFTAISAAQVNIIAIAQDATERNLTIVVKQKHLKTALQSIHDCFYTDLVV